MSNLLTDRQEGGWCMYESVHMYALNRYVSGNDKCLELMPSQGENADHRLCFS